MYTFKQRRHRSNKKEGTTILSHLALNPNILKGYATVHRIHSIRSLCIVRPCSWCDTSGRAVWVTALRQAAKKSKWIGSDWMDWAKPQYQYIYMALHRVHSIFVKPEIGIAIDRTLPLSPALSLSATRYAHTPRYICAYDTYEHTIIRLCVGLPAVSIHSLIKKGVD